MPRVEAWCWDPRRPVFGGRLGRRLPIRRGIGNFGDLLGPLVVDGLLALRGITPDSAKVDARLLSIGSVLHFARDGDVVWGSGRNGKQPDSHHVARQLDVRAVRGPLSRGFLEHLGIPTPAVYGDPALLLPLVRPELAAAAREPQHDLTIVPNLNDAAGYPQSDDLLHPQQPLAACLERIARSRLVVGSSLHGIIVAESLGVPARLVRSAAEHPFKYEDYYQGTGRASYQAAPDVATAIAWGGEPPPNWTPEALLEAFPWDLWQAQPDEISPPGGRPA